MKVLIDFIDIATGKEYKAGDIYDTEGISEAKIEFMSTPNAQRGALIGEEAPETTVDDAPEGAEEDETEGNTEEVVEV